MAAAAVQQAYIPFMLAVKGQLRTVELSVLRYDAQNIFLSKPESAPPIEQKWRVAPLRWSAEREPFCVLTHRETGRLRLVVAKPDSACELWPVMYSSDQPDGGIPNCSISPARCKLVPFMFQGGLYLVAIEKEGLGVAPPVLPGAILQINAPQEAWQCVRDMVTSGNYEWTQGKRARIAPFYHRQADGQVATYMLVQEDCGTCEVRQVVDPSHPWQRLVKLPPGTCPMPTSKVQFVYCRLPPELVTGACSQWPIEVFATWLDGCTLYLAQVVTPDQPWKMICAVPAPPHSRLGAVYVPFLPEPLLVTTSRDPHYVGSVAVRRLFLAERLLVQQGLLPSDSVTPPRLLRYMQVPALPVSPRDLTADLPITDFPYRDFPAEFIGKRLPYDLTPPNMPLLPVFPPPPRVPSHGPVGLLLRGTQERGAAMASLQVKQWLDWTNGPAIDQPSGQWKVTPLRWAPGREALFVLLQSRERRVTRVALAIPDKPCDEWVTQYEFDDATVPFSESTLIPFQYQTVPGSSDMFVMVIHHGSGKGGLFFVATPKSEWQFIREIDEPELLNPDSNIKVMYHRSKDPQSVNLCTFFVVTSKSHDSQLSVRVIIEPNQPTFDVTPAGGFDAESLPCANADIRILYAYSPKPPVTHVWPCEVFACWIDVRTGLFTVMHIPAPDLAWRRLYSQQLPVGMRVTPLYLPYLAEPLILGTANAATVDLIRLNLVESFSEGPSKAGAKFVMRYGLHSGQEVVDIADTTLDTALVWMPQMGLQGMHPYSGYPLPFEKHETADYYRK